MRILILTVVMICLNQKTFGTAKRSLEADIDNIHIIRLFNSLNTLIEKEARSLEIEKVIAEIKNENKLDDTLLNFAVIHKCTPNVVRLLHQKSGETINQQQASSGHTPLMHASLYNSPELLSVLLELDNSPEHVRNYVTRRINCLNASFYKGTYKHSKKSFSNRLRPWAYMYEIFRRTYSFRLCKKRIQLRERLLILKKLKKLMEKINAKEQNSECQALLKNYAMK